MNTPLPDIELYGMHVDRETIDVPDVSDFGLNRQMRSGRITVAVTGRHKNRETTITITATVDHTDLDRAIGHAVQRIAAAPTYVDQEQYEYPGGVWQMVDQQIPLLP